MSFKTIFIVIVTAVVTYLFMLNFETMEIKLVPGDSGPVLEVYKSIFLVSTALLCFLAGYLGGRMGRRKKRREREIIVKHEQSPVPPSQKINPEDQEYLGGDERNDRI